MKLFTFPKCGQTVEEVLRKALEEAEDYDDIVIVMQSKKEGTGLRWLGRDDSTAANLVFLLSSALFHFQCMVAGVTF